MVIWNIEEKEKRKMKRKDHLHRLNIDNSKVGIDATTGFISIQI